MTLYRRIGITGIFNSIRRIRAVPAESRARRRYSETDQASLTRQIESKLLIWINQIPIAVSKVPISLFSS